MKLWGTVDLSVLILDMIFQTDLGTLDGLIVIVFAQEQGIRLDLLAPKAGLVALREPTFPPCFNFKTGSKQNHNL